LFGTKWSGIRVEYFFCPRTPEGFNCQGRCYIVSKGEIDLHFYEFFRKNLRLSGVIGQNLFTDSLGH
jgi:hypothetical protein